MDQIHELAVEVGEKVAKAEALGTQDHSNTVHIPWIVLEARVFSSAVCRC